jgi:hypothetical protein
MERQLGAPALNAGKNPEITWVGSKHVGIFSKKLTTYISVIYVTPKNFCFKFDLHLES